MSKHLNAKILKFILAEALIVIKITQGRIRKLLEIKKKIFSIVIRTEIPVYGEKGIIIVTFDDS